MRKRVIGRRSLVESMLCGRWRIAGLRDRSMGDGFKPPHAALAEDRRGERCGKGAHDASGGGEGDDRCVRVESIEATSEPGYSKGSGRSLAGAHLLARRCPAQRRRDPRLRLSQGTWEGERGHGSPFWVWRGERECSGRQKP